MTGWNDADSAQLTALAAQRAQVEANMREQVSRLRQQECPWSVIGDALGVSKQAAQKKYAAQRVSLVDRPLRTSD